VYLSGHLRRARRNRAEGNQLHRRQREPAIWRRKTMKDGENRFFEITRFRKQMIL